MTKYSTECSGGRPGSSAPLAVGLLLSAVVCGCGPADVAAPLPIAVQVVSVTPESFTTEMRYSATVKELQKVELSFKVAGTVQDLLQVTDPTTSQPRDVQVGDAVPAGAVLARLDDADYRRQENAAREQLAKAESQRVAAAAEAELAAKDLARAQALSAKGRGRSRHWTRPSGVRSSRVPRSTSAERDVEAARIAEQQAQDDLANCALKVPAFGQAYVAEKSIERSERVTPNRITFLLIDVSKVRVAFGVPDVFLGDLQLGQELPVVAESLGGQPFSGQISKIAPAADLRTRTFLIEVTIDDPGRLKPGMIVTTCIGENRQGLLLPMTAIQRGGTASEYVVYKVVSQAGQNVVCACRVELDGVYDNRIHVKTGPGSEIAAGDAVVVVGAWRLSEGQPVRIIEQEVRS